MTHRFSFPAVFLALVCSVGIVGCGGSGGEAEFVETDVQSADEAAESEAYEEQMKKDSERMRKEYSN